MKSYAVHYKNVFPGGKVEWNEMSLDAYDFEGVHRIALRIGGGGVVIDKGAEYGATDVHDLSPIPKNARVYKLFADGKMGLSEEGIARAKSAAKIADKTGKVLSIKAYQDLGKRFDSEGNLEIPAPVIPAPVATAPVTAPTAPQE